MSTPSSPTALRVVLWGTTALVVAAVSFVALVPGPELPPVYGDLSALHDSLVRMAEPGNPTQSRLLGRVEATVGDGTVTTWLYRHDGAMVSVHQVEDRPPRPRGASSVAGMRSGSFAFERGDLLFLVMPVDGGATLVAGYASITVLRSMLDQVLESGPGPNSVPSLNDLRESDSPPRPAGPPAAPPTP